MNNHDLPEGFKMTELGPLPQEWEVVRLGALGQVSAGGSAPQESKYFGGNNPFIRVQHLDEGGYEVRRWDLITDEGVRRYRLRLYPAGTIVFPKSGASIRLEKRAVLGQPSYLVSHLCAIIPNQDFVEGDFLFFALRSIPLASEKAEGYPTLSLSEIRGHLLPLPPLPEQRAIAQVLRTVQRAKEATERVLAATRELKKSLMRHLFTYGPVPVDQADQVRLQETELGPLPEGWRVVRLGEVALIKTGPFGSSLKKSELVKNGFKVYEQENILRENFSIGNDYITSEKYEILRTFAIEKGDILVSRVGSFGKTVVVPGNIAPGIFGSRVLRIRCFPSLLPDFVRYSFSTIQVQIQVAQNARGVTLQGLNTSILSMLLIPLPPLPEQQAIANVLQTVDRKIQAEERRKAALDALFKTLLQHLMTGKVRVRGAITEPEE